MHHLHNFNHLAILVSGVVLWLLGAVWYSPVLFAKPWMAIVGIQPGNAKKSSMITGMISSFLLDLVMAFVLDHVIKWSGADTFAMGSLVGFIMWVGFIAAPLFPQGIYEGRPFKLFTINAGYQLVGLLIIGGILAVWR